jgi:hypothetical protein
MNGEQIARYFYQSSPCTARQALSYFACLTKAAGYEGLRP